MTLAERVMDAVSTSEGATEAKRFPPYVFSLSGNACLVHRIARVEIHWLAPNGRGEVVRRQKPKLIARCVCGATRFLKAAMTRTCMVPDPDALLCGRCHGDVATFGKHGPATKAGIRRTEAHVKLGCVVKGY